MKTTQFISGVILLLVMSACPTIKKGMLPVIKFKNSLNNADILVLRSKEYLFDTLLPTQKPSSANFEQLMGETEVYTAWGCSGSLKLCILNSPQKALSIYVFHKDTLNQVPWDSIRVNKNYLKHFIIKPNDVDTKDDFTIFYP